MATKKKTGTKKDGRSVKSAAHKKAISDGLKRYHATKLKAGAKKSPKSTTKPPKKSFDDWHKRHDANQRSRAAAAKKYYATPEAKRLKEIHEEIMKLQDKAMVHGIAARVRGGKTNSAQAANAKLKSVNTKLTKLYNERRKLQDKLRAQGF